MLRHIVPLIRTSRYVLPQARTLSHLSIPYEKEERKKEVNNINYMQKRNFVSYENIGMMVGCLTVPISGVFLGIEIAKEGYHDDKHDSGFAKLAKATAGGSLGVGMGGVIGCIAAMVWPVTLVGAGIGGIVYAANTKKPPVKISTNVIKDINSKISPGINAVVDKIDAREFNPVVLTPKKIKDKLPNDPIPPTLNQKYRGFKRKI